MDEPESIGLEVIRVLVSHHAGGGGGGGGGGTDLLLGIRELGRLSLVSKTVAAILEDDALVWKNLFEKAAACGRGCYNGNHFGGHFLYNEHSIYSWKGEKGLLGCFSDPSNAVIERVGYKQAAACLLGKCCTHCGQLSGHANPLTLERVCKECYEADTSSYIITKTKAKEAFRLTEKDMNVLHLLQVKASFADIGLCGGKSITSCFLLADDVKNAAFAKHGGADGLAMVFQQKKDAASERFVRRQASDKPQKKRSKVERMCDRPADHLSDICSPCLPIGTFFDTKSMKMKHSVQCNKCPASGCLTDIIMHEKLEHGLITNYHSNQDPGLEDIPRAVTCAEFEGLIPISDLAAGPTEGYMTRLFSSASFEYARLDFESRLLVEERKVCFITFEQQDVQVCIDFIYLPDPSTNLYYSANIDVCFKKRTDQFSLNVLSFDLDNGYGVCSMGDDFNHDNFVALVTALGITEQEVEEAALMAMFVSRVCDRRVCNLYCNEIETMEGYDNVEDYHIPMFFHVFNALMSKTEV